MRGAVVVLRIVVHLPHVRGLRSLGALGNIEDDRLAFLQGAVAETHDRGVVNEYIALLAIWSDESESLLGVEPLHRSVDVLLAVRVRQFLLLR